MEEAAPIPFIQPINSTKKRNKFIFFVSSIDFIHEIELAEWKSIITVFTVSTETSIKHK